MNSQNDRTITSSNHRLESAFDVTRLFVPRPISIPGSRLKSVLGRVLPTSNAKRHQNTYFHLFLLREARLFNIAVDTEKKKQLELEQQVHYA